MSTGLNARRATGLTVAQSKEGFTRTESVASWSREGRAAYEAESEALLFLFLFFLQVQGVPIRQKNISQKGRGFFFLSEIICDFIYIVFAVLLCRAVLSRFSYIHHIKKRK